MAKEFETVGFFISDHPLNQYQDIFKEFNILSYKNVNEDKEISEGSVAATILKIQEKKTQKGTSYAIIKFSDQSSIFELFVFSDTFELNRAKIKEGNSVILTLQKITRQNEPQSTRLNVKKIISLDDLVNKPINSISFKVKNVDEVDILSKMLKKGGDVEVNINIISSDKAYKVKLKDKRFIDRKTVNLIKNQGISTTIH
jgi:DNA polymerase-3 subunit alpha